MNKRVYLKEWLGIKPYETVTKTDAYYLEICNRVKDIIAKNVKLYESETEFMKENINPLACFLTCYFEDLISETNIWNSFVSAHKRLYQKPLPFYDVEEYFEEELNPQDIAFLMWYFMSFTDEDCIQTPTSDFILDTSEKVLEVFDNAWEYAPENLELKSFYVIDENEINYYKVRGLMENLMFKSYLFHPDTAVRLKMQLRQILNDQDLDLKNNPNANGILSEAFDSFLHKLNTNLLSLSAKEWAAELVNSNAILSKDISEMSRKITGYFLYKGQDNDNVFLEHIASGKKFDLTKKSFDHSASLTEIDTLMLIGLIRWRNEWWFSGLLSQQDFNAETVEKEKRSHDSKTMVAFLDNQDEKKAEIVKNQFSAFLAFNNGSQIAFLPSQEIDGFRQRFFDFYNNSLNLSKKVLEEAMQRYKNEKVFDQMNEPKPFSIKAQSSLVFFNPKSGLEMAEDINSAFPMPSNPFFNEKKSEEHIVELIINKDLSAELAQFCFDNCKDELPFFTEDFGKEFIADFDFVLRFYKRGNYHAEPLVTFV